VSEANAFNTCGIFGSLISLVLYCCVFEGVMFVWRLIYSPASTETYHYPFVVLQLSLIWPYVRNTENARTANNCCRNGFFSFYL